ncbi:uncharacterized protein [Asterias amurensis]
MEDYEPDWKKPKDWDTAIYACPDCDYTFMSKKNLETHRGTHQKKNFFCKSCDKRYTRKDNLRVHYKKKHETEEERRAARPLEDEFDVPGGSSAPSGRSGRKRKESEVANARPKKESRKNRPRPASRRPETQEKDEEVLRHVRRMEDHESGWKKPKDWDTAINACPDCDDTFMSKKNLETHRGTHQKKNFFCKSCDKSYTRKDNLMVHYNKKHQDEDDVPGGSSAPSGRSGRKRKGPELANARPQKKSRKKKEGTGRTTEPQKAEEVVEENQIPMTPGRNL